MSPAVATVVIVNYNGAHLLPSCLDALDAQRVDAPAFDTVVVDNASTDGSRQLLASEYPWARVIASETNTGFAGGNNLALRGLGTPFAVLLNNDAAPEPGWLAQLMAPFFEAGAERLGVVNGKIVFMPRFVRMSFETKGFQPGAHDSRDLGVQVHRVVLDVSASSASSASSESDDSSDVTAKVLWESAAYGPERSGGQEFRWTRPSGEILVPVPAGCAPDGKIERPVRVRVTVVAEAVKPFQLNDVTAEVGPGVTEIEVELPAGTAAVDVVNNAGGIVLREGYGADRGFQQVDDGQFAESVEVFNGCGNGMAIRSELGEQLGWFDDDFFMYYEDTDLSWRIRSHGWAIRYQPAALLRHIHAASSKEWSPSWVFHVDRNRLLMLTKNASAGLALRAVLRYPLTTASMAARAGVEGLRTRRRPALRPHLLRARVFGSYLRLLPRMLDHRRRIGRSATVSRSELETWLVDR